MSKVLNYSNFNFKNQTSKYEGKVRDVYTLGDNTLVMIASDRISAFDVVMPRGITFKGQVLNQIAVRMLNKTKDIVPNWLEINPDPNVSIGKKCDPIKVEMVVRGYLSGHAYREYKSGKRKICGNKIPDGLKENDKFGIDFSISGNNKLFFDIIYNPFNTDFSEAGNKSGNTIKNGLNMFLFQAQKAFSIWHNIEPEIDQDVIKFLKSYNQ